MVARPRLVALALSVLLVSPQFIVVASSSEHKPDDPESSHTQSPQGRNQSARQHNDHEEDHDDNVSAGNGSPSASSHRDVSEADVSCLVDRLVVHRNFRDMAWLAMVLDTAVSAVETSPTPYIAVQWYAANAAEFGPMTQQAVLNHLDGATEAFRSAATSCKLPLDLATKPNSAVAQQLGRRLALFGSPPFTAVGWGVAIGAVSTLAVAAAAAGVAALLPATAPVLAAVAVGSLVAGLFVTPVLEDALTDQAVKVDPELAAVKGSLGFELSKSAGELLGGITTAKLPWSVGLAPSYSSDRATWARMFRPNSNGGLRTWWQGSGVAEIKRVGKYAAVEELRPFDKYVMGADIVTVGSLVVTAVQAWNKTRGGGTTTATGVSPSPAQAEAACAGATPAGQAGQPAQQPGGAAAQAQAQAQAAALANPCPAQPDISPEPPMAAQSPSPSLQSRPPSPPTSPAPILAHP